MKDLRDHWDALAGRTAGAEKICLLLDFDGTLVLAATDPANYRVSRWNYRRTEEYGSGHFRLDGSPGQDLLPVFSAHLSDDRKSVYLAVPDIREVMQMEVTWQVAARSAVT